MRRTGGDLHETDRLESLCSAYDHSPITSMLPTECPSDRDCFSYGCVSFCLITTGLLFTVFAVFQKDSQIGKVWLAGPTTMVVGLVLCGKVIIDWGPAMMHAHQRYSDYTVDGVALILFYFIVIADANDITPLHRNMVAFKDPITVPFLSDQNIRFSIANGVVKASTSDAPGNLLPASRNSRAFCAMHPYKTMETCDFGIITSNRKTKSGAHLYSATESNNSTLRSSWHPNCCHFHDHLRDSLITTNKSSILERSHIAQEMNSETMPAVQTVVASSAGHYRPVTGPFSPITTECGKFKRSLSGDSLYGAINKIMEPGNDHQCNKPHNSYCYQGETFVLNHRNYLI